MDFAAPGPDIHSMPAVSSTAILCIEYNGFQHELQITFVGGNTYVYYDVPRGIYVGLLCASSKGSYFNTCIRDHFRFAQLPNPDS